MISPEDFIDQIDQKFGELRGKENRFCLEWGYFSRDMNVKIRRYCKELAMTSVLRQKYIYVQNYWTIKSGLLNLYMRHKLVATGKKKRENKMAKEIKQIILELEAE